MRRTRTTTTTPRWIRLTYRRDWTRTERTRRTWRYTVSYYYETWPPFGVLIMLLFSCQAASEDNVNELLYDEDENPEVEAEEEPKVEEDEEEEEEGERSWKR